MALFPHSISLIGLYAGLVSVAFAGSFTFTTISEPSATGEPYSLGSTVQAKSSAPTPMEP